MKSLFVLFISALLSIGASACGGSAKSTGSTSHSSSGAGATSTAASTTASGTTSTQDFRTADSDKDNDIGAPYDDKNNNSALDYGHAASAADKQTVTELVKRYYAIAAAGNGATACSMLSSSLAEAVVEDYGHGSAGPAYLGTGTSCPAVMTLLFKHSQSQLAAELPKLKVVRVRLVGHRGFAIMNFGTMPEREISVAREGHAWKIQELLATDLP